MNHDSRCEDDELPLDVAMRSVPEADAASPEKSRQRTGRERFATKRRYSRRPKNDSARGGIGRRRKKKPGK